MEKNEKLQETLDAIATQLEQTNKLLARFEFHYYNLSRDINALTDAMEGKFYDTDTPETKPAY